ncbi:MAG: PilZ domain-containing protein [Spirochaetaceae bacterium]|jgi:hypothetical protein|nr:PilZ domain-containing protein [Spirochaetaceae bacterium]
MHRLYLLQDITEFKIQSNPLDTAGFLIMLASLTALIIFLNVSKKVRNSAIFRGKGVAIAKKDDTSVDSAFYREVKHIGLDKREASVLEKILKDSDEDPIKALHNEEKTDECFNHYYKKISRDYRDEEALPLLLDLFSIRNAVEYFYAYEKNTSNKVVRNYRRKSITSSCVFYLVVSIKQKHSNKKKLLVEDDCKYKCDMLNVSQGGCAISMTQYIKAGQMIKIEFHILNKQISALGQILRLNKDGDNWIYHIKFLRLPKKSLVALNAYIFGY